MAFEYGSDTLGIKNPFKFEGFILTVRGVLVTVLGIVALFAVKELVTSGDKIAGWLSLGIGVILLSNGLVAIGRGLFKVMRFYVGRSVPASLSPNKIIKAPVTEPETAYKSAELEQMLMGRKNTTFSEPFGWLALLLHTLMPKLLFMPYPIRNLALKLSSGLIYSILAFLCFGLSWFSGSTGLTDISNTPVLDWLSLLLAGYLFLVWSKRRLPIEQLLREKINTSGTIGIYFMIVFSIFSPVALSYIHNNVRALPELPVSAGGYIAFITLLGAIASGYGLLLIYLRAKPINPVTEVSEFRTNWQESIHPQEIFINFENIVMANRRYKEIPNRVYHDIDAQLIEQGSNDKGKFSGKMVQETQPIFKESSFGAIFKQLRIFGTIIGESLLAVSAVLLYLAIDPVTHISSDLTPAIDALVYPLLIWIFGQVISNTAIVFWSEMQFESLIVYLQCHGTYSESKVSTGASIHDSTRSENVVVRSSLSPWILTSRLVTYCFAESGRNNLENPRRILEMHKADDDLNNITDEIRDFLGNRETIAGIKEKDLASASSIYQVNQETRSHDAKSAITQDKKVELTEERIAGNLEGQKMDLDVSDTSVGND